MDLFDDLPVPKNESSNTQKFISNNDKEEDLSKNKKRAIEDTEESKSENNNEKKVRSETNIKLIGYFAERQGERDDMQDRHVIINNFLDHIKEPSSDIKNVSYYAVFDGHSGSRASEFCANKLHIILAEKFPKGNIENIEKEIKRCFIDTFKQIDDEFLKLASKNKPAWKDGTTVTVILVINDTLFAANLGDSKAIIVRTNEKNEYFPIVLTKDHNPTLYDERQRIQKTGAQVKDGRILGVLEISRSIGDGQFKAYGVSCIPDIRKCQLNSTFQYIVIACDGLWKSFSNDEAIEFINKSYENSIQNHENSLENDSKNDYAYETTCNKIANEAVKKLTADNVTVLIISIKH